MKTLLIIVLSMVTITASAQIWERDRAIVGFLKMGKVCSPRSRKIPPTFTQFSGSERQSAFGYWFGSSVTRYSANGRVKSVDMFDMNGQLRESRASITLSRRGPGSAWSIQLSPQRSRPLFIYTLPN